MSDKFDLMGYAETVTSSTPKYGELIWNVRDDFRAKIDKLRDRWLEQKRKGKKVFIVLWTGGTFQSWDTDRGRSPNGTLKESFDALGLPRDDLVFLELIDLMQLDSSQMTVDHWRFLAEMIIEIENSSSDWYDAIIVTHGTDTMARGASYLSFMLKWFPKSIIFTGSQEPARMSGSDAKDQMERALLTAKIATNPNNLIAEVMVCNGLLVTRGTWAKKLSDHSANVHGPWNQPSGQFDTADWHEAVSQGKLHHLSPALLNFGNGIVTAKMRFAPHARRRQDVGAFEPFTDVRQPANIHPIPLTDTSPVTFARNLVSNRVNVLTLLGSATADDRLVTIALAAANLWKAIYFASLLPNSQAIAGKYAAWEHVNDIIDLIQRPLPTLNLSPDTHPAKVNYLLHRLWLSSIDWGSGIGEIFSPDDLKRLYNALEANLVWENG